MPELINLGSLCIDYVYAVPSIVRGGETVLGAGPVRHAGGKGLNQSLAAARAGARVTHVGRVGQDGVWLQELLRSEGVDADGVRICTTQTTGHAIIQVDPRGENAIVIVGGANRCIEPDDVERAISRAGSGGWLLLQNEINDIGDVLQAARGSGVRVAFNVAPIDARAAGYALDAVELLLLNEIEATALAGESDAAAALERLTRDHPGQHVVITLGRDGVWYGYGPQRLRLPSFEVAAVDETGAGDAFIGYLMAALLEGLPVYEQLRRASAAGALAVCTHGAAPAIPDAAAVQAFLENDR